MDILLLALAAFGISMLTYYSGFGLGTLLLPFFMLYFPAPHAVALTGVVHLLNNLFKFALTRRMAHWGVVLRFGLPALLAALAGAWLLLYLEELPAVGSYSLWHHTWQVQPVKLVLALLLLFFVAWEWVPGLRGWQVPPRWLPVGGLLSGFFGGLAGMQGALRSAFLLRIGLTKEAYIATGIVLATLIDLGRLGMYASRMHDARLWEHPGLLAATTGAAIAGAWLGHLLLHKVTLMQVQRLTSILLVCMAIALGMGLV